MSASRTIGRWCAISTFARTRSSGGRPHEVRNFMTDAAWKLERDSDSIAWLTIDKPGTSANVLSSGVLRELDALLEPLARTPPRAVIVLSGKKSGFIAGADIKEFTDITNVE